MARLLEQSGVLLTQMRDLLRAAIETAIRLSHPAYDCFYICLAAANGGTFVTADERLVRKLRDAPSGLRAVVQTLAEAAADA